MAAPKVNESLLRKLSSMGFSLPLAIKALHYSGNTNIEEAVNWMVDHEDDPNIDQNLEVLVDINIDSDENFQLTEEMTRKAQELRDRARGNRENEEKQSEIEREKDSKPVVKFTSNINRMRECLRCLKHHHMDDSVRVRRAFRTLLIYITNVARNPNEAKFRKIRINNPSFQINIKERVGNLEGGIAFLELCGFVRTEAGDFLYLPLENVDVAVLKSAGLELYSAITNPFFGVISRCH